MENTENSVVNCGECDRIGYQNEIQKHLLEVHILTVVDPTTAEQFF